MLADIEKAILADNIKFALVKTKVHLKENNSNAYNIIRVLSQRAFEWTKQNTCVNSSCSDIFHLADLCASTLAKSWNCDHYKLMQCLYHILNFLLKQGDTNSAKNLADYFIKLKQFTKTSWNANQKTLLSSTYIVFANYVNKHQIISKKKCGDDSLIVWCKFIFSLIEVNNFDNIDVWFILLFNIIKVKKSNPCETKLFIDECFKILSPWISSMEKEKMADKELCNILVLLDYYVSFIPKGGQLDLKEVCLMLKSLLAALTSSAQVRPIFEAIYYTMCTVADVKSGNLTMIDKIMFLIKNKLPAFSTKEIYILLSNLLFDLSIAVSNSGLRDPASLINLLLDYFNLVILNTVKTLTGKPRVKVLSLPLFGVFKIAVASSEAQLKEMFSSVKTCFRYFSQIQFSHSVNDLKYGVFLSVDIIKSYYNCKLYSEASFLSRYIIVIVVNILKSEKTVPDFLQVDMERLLSLMVKSCAEVNVNCLPILLGIAGEMKYVNNVFPYWCELKQKAFSKFATCTAYDIICPPVMDETLTDSSWPNNVIMDLDYEKYLLHEVYSYTKFRKLKKEPVLAVYKISVKMVKNKNTLAEILCCVCDALTSEQDLLPNISNIETSILNVIKGLVVKTEVSSDWKQKSILGDLYYQQARCELFRLRRQVKVDYGDITILEDMPVITEGENEQPPKNVFSLLQISDQVKFLELLGRAYDYWSGAVSQMENNAVYDCYHTLSFIKSLGYFYRLYKYRSRETLIWQLLYKMAKKFNERKYIIIGVAELLECKQTVDEAQIDFIHKLVEKDKSLQCSYYHTVFLINLAKNKFYNKEYEKSEAIFSSLVPDKVKQNKLIFTYYEWSKVTLLSDKKPMLSSEKYNLETSLLNTFTYALSIFTQGYWGSFSEQCITQYLLLDSSLSLGKHWCDVGDVQLSKLYLKNQSERAHFLALPLRTCEMICAQAQIDLVTANSEDLNKKLNSCQAILEITCMRKNKYDKSSSQSISHLSNCKCHSCHHSEQLMVKLWFSSLLAGYFHLLQDKNNAVLLFKDGMQLLTRVKKNMNSDLTQIAEHEIRFYLSAVESLIGWKSYEKANNYLEVVEGKFKTLAYGNKYLFSKIQRMKFGVYKMNLNLNLIPHNTQNTSLEKEDKENNDVRTPVSKSKPELHLPALGHQISIKKYGGLIPRTPIEKKNFDYIEKSTIKKGATCETHIQETSEAPKIVITHCDSSAEKEKAPPAIQPKPKRGRPKKIIPVCSTPDKRIDKEVKGSTSPLKSDKQKSRVDKDKSYENNLFETLKSDSDPSVIESSFRSVSPLAFALSPENPPNLEDKFSQLTIHKDSNSLFSVKRTPRAKTYGRALTATPKTNTVCFEQVGLESKKKPRRKKLILSATKPKRL